MIDTEKIVKNYNSYIVANRRKWKPLELYGGRFEGVWNAGGDYSNISKYPGAYSKSEWERLEAMFPSVDRGNYLHLFSGGIPAGGYYRICETSFPDGKTDKDLHIRFPDEREKLSCFIDNKLDLIFADPPWNEHHANKTYGVEYLNKKAARDECHWLLKPGGILVWKDAISLPRDNKLFEYIGFIAVDPSSGHMDRSFRFFRKR